MSETTSRWYHGKWVVLTALLLVYPLGLILLYSSPPQDRRGKWPLALLFLGVFGLQCYVVFGLGPAGVKASIRKTIVWWHDQRINRQRAAANQTIEDVPPEALVISDDDWPEFRGRNRDGIVPDGTHHLPWPADGPTLLWEQLVGVGHGSMAVAGDRLYTLEQREGDEAVTCFSLETGGEVWAYRYPALFEESMGGPGPRSTPTVTPHHLFALGATGVLNCLHPLSGELIWSRNILEDAGADNLYFGMACSPLVDAGLVFVVSGGKQASVIAYRAASGEIEWKGGGHSSAYASPAIVEILGTRQLVVFDGAGLSAYVPATGESLWHFPWETDFGVNASQPIVLDNGQVFISSGYGTGCALVQIEEADGTLSAREVWSNRNLKMRYVCGVRVGEAVIGADDKVLTCIDLETGDRLWKKGRYGECQIIRAGSHLVVQCENGDLALLEARSDELKEVSRVPALDRKTVQPPVIAKGRLIIRNDRNIRCYDLRVP